MRQSENDDGATGVLPGPETARERALDPSIHCLMVMSGGSFMLR